MKRLLFDSLLVFLFGCGPQIQGNKIQYLTGQGWTHPNKTPQKMSMDSKLKYYSQKDILCSIPPVLKL